MSRMLLLLPLVAGCLATPDDTPETNFETLWSEFDRMYGLFPVKDIDWDAEYETYRPQVDADTTDAELAEIFKAMLAPLNDGHVFLATWEGEDVWTSYDGGRDNDDFDFDLIDTELLQAPSTGVDGFSHGRLTDDVGYLRLHHVDMSNPQRTLGPILDDLADTDTLVIDIRHNGGGNDTTATAVASCFADVTTPYMQVRLRNGPEHTDFTDPILFDLEPSTDCHYDGDVILVTNAFGFSAAEVFAMGMVALPQVTHIGEHTAGSFSDVVTRELPNGWAYSLSIGDWRDADGVNHEGIGIVPTVEVLNTAEAITEGRDLALERALELAEQ